MQKTPTDAFDHLFTRGCEGSGRVDSSLAGGVGKKSLYVLILFQGFEAFYQNTSVMVNHYFLMRHGESQANQRSLIVSDPRIGCESFGLTDKGKKQARSAAVDSGLPRYTVVVSSDFARAKETAQIVKETLKCKDDVLVKPGLRERFFGKLDGKPSENYDKVWAKDSKDSFHTPFGAESPRHLVMRLRRVIDSLETQFKGATILLVSHGDPLRFLQLEMAGMDLTRHMEIRHFRPAEIRALDELLRI